jgi:hypothetical protein
MPADFSNYVDMIPEDVSPGDIYVGSIELARLTLPEFKIRPGTPEDALLQAAAYMSHLTVSHLNRLPPRLMEGVANLLGVEKNEGARASVEVTLTLNQNIGIDIPSGTTFFYNILSGGESSEYVYETTEDIVVADWTASPAVMTTVLTSRLVGVHPVVPSGTEFMAQTILFELDTVKAEQAGTAAAGSTTTITLNSVASATDDYYVGRTVTIESGTGSGQSAEITGYVGSTKVATIATLGIGLDATSVYTTDVSFVNGESPEGGYDYLTRATTHLRGLSSSLVKASQVKSALLVNNEVLRRVKVYDLTASSASLRLLSDVDALGNVAIFSYGNNRQLTGAEKNELVDYSTKRGVAGLTFNAADMHLVDVEVDLTVKYDDRYSLEAITGLVRRQILGFLSPLQFVSPQEGWSEGDISSLVQGVSGVLFVESVTFSVPAGSSGTGHAYSTLYSVSGATGNVEFTAKGVLPDLTSGNLTVTFDAVTVS